MGGRGFKWERVIVASDLSAEMGRGLCFRTREQFIAGVSGEGMAMGKSVVAWKMDPICGYGQS